MSVDIGLARQFAIKWHGDQQYGHFPYVVHLDEVAAILQTHEAAPWQVVAGYLHDVLEDTLCPAELIAAQFGAEVLRWVTAVTGVGDSRKERQQHIVRQLRDVVPEAGILKLADRLANVKACAAMAQGKKLEMYRKELPLYAAIFEKANPLLYAELQNLL